MKRIKIGDVVEIPTSLGFAYAQYTHKVKKWGDLLRVFNTIYKKRPSDFSIVVLDKVRFSQLFPLGAAISRNIFIIVSNEVIAEELTIFPIFKAGGAYDPKTKKFKNWWLWDGKREWEIGKLADDLLKLPNRGICNDTMLIHKIESGWIPENDPRI